MKWIAALLLGASLVPAFAQTKSSHKKQMDSHADFIVYGATASGVMTAYSAAREGLSVVLLEPGDHVGGMLSGGLSATDLGRYSIIGGYAREFYMRVARYYGHDDLSKGAYWRPEPHVAEEILRAMLDEAHVKVYFHERLREHGGVRTHAGMVRSVTTEDGRSWSAKVFADCSYEGDLMKQAGVHYTWGREGVSVYNEDLAGVRAETPNHQFPWPLSAYDEQHHLYPEVSAAPLAAPGTGDKLVQAYNFRVIVTRDPANRLAFPKPAHYNPHRFALLAAYLKQFAEKEGRAPLPKDVFLPGSIPNAKADFNNRGPFSTDFIGHSAEYPDASYARRAAIWKEHMQYTQGLFYFLTNDESVPAELRKAMQEWGLPRDEFADTNHWPFQLYVREGRRMIGTYVMRQSDLQTERTKTDSIGMGSYNSDSHNVQRIAMHDGTVKNEGNVEVHVQPYEIPYRVLLPQRAEATNLLVPVCFSASHIAYSSLRMEPQYMILGQAAGTAAAIAVETKKAVQDVSVSALQKNLHEHGAVLSLDEEITSPKKDK
ncbi:MAG: FAD-dependent oxidoreductase [Acidobacteria bacterium]|nr:FAD-dependent oxidoreductase [Acidobacteriota bacterium]